MVRSSGGSRTPWWSRRCHGRIVGDKPIDWHIRDCGVYSPWHLGRTTVEMTAEFGRGGPPRYSSTYLRRHTASATPRGTPHTTAHGECLQRPPSIVNVHTTYTTHKSRRAFWTELEVRTADRYTQYGHSFVACCQFGSMKNDANRTRDPRLQTRAARNVNSTEKQHCYSV